MTKEEKKDYRKNITCQYSEKKIVSDKVIDHCPLTCSHRGPVHSICIFIVTQKRSNFIPIILHNFIIYDCHLIFKIAS